MRYWNDVPKSPRATFLTKLTYCSVHERSRPHSTRTRSMSSGLPPGPTSSIAGSPVMRMIVKIVTLSRNRLIMLYPSRRATYPRMAASSACQLDVFVRTKIDVLRDGALDLLGLVRDSRAEQVDER